MRNSAYLIVALVIGTAGRAVAGDEDCAAGHLASDPVCAADYLCVPQATTQSLEVTEWGVQSEVICPPRGTRCCLGLLWRHVSGVLTCSAASDVACDDACDAACDDGCGICECANGPGWLGLGPRVRKKLMRKTLVYTVPAVQCVAQPLGGDCTHCAALTGGDREVQIQFARGTSPTESLAATADLADVRWLNTERAVQVQWLTVDDTAETLQLNAALAPIEPGESLGTMSETLGVQPPAPIATLPAAAGSVPALLLPIAGQR